MTRTQRPLTEKQARRCIEFCEPNLRQGGYLLGTILTGVAVVSFWGRGSREYLLMFTWSAGAIIYAAFRYFRGWVPWAVYLYSFGRGLPLKKELESPVQQVIRAFLRFPVQRNREVRLALVGALVPWAIWLPSAALDLPSIGHHPWKDPLSGSFLGLVIGSIYAKSWSLFGMSRNLRLALICWPELVQETEQSGRDMA